jgi:hypothetical protein
MCAGVIERIQSFFFFEINHFFSPFKLFNNHPEKIKTLGTYYPKGAMHGSTLIFNSSCF